MDLQGSNPSTVWFGGTRVLVRVTAAQSGGRLGAWESEESLGVALPLHTLWPSQLGVQIVGPPLALDRASITE